MRLSSPHTVIHAPEYVCHIGGLLACLTRERRQRVDTFQADVHPASFSTPYSVGLTLAHSGLV
jgi:hypothetical protein